MSRIRLLPEDVASQVAAGEVVERPASVVKELVENSIDARASRIEVLIRRGGISLIKVVDDGVGMDRDDALLCLERHATSKIRTGHDLAAISTLGFRGEALP
ncbi:MAG: ATP-binding protein, partial [Verrucomicrobiota bacterium]|nr:ATP-binding protein [Verrucomicrobiota bacterium]